MEVQLGDYIVEVCIERKKNKNIYFRFKEDNILYITCNKFVSINEIKRLIKKNEKSLLRMYEKSLKVQENNIGFWYLGKSYTIVYDDNYKDISIDDNFIYVKNEKVLNKWLSKEIERIYNLEINKLLPLFNNIPKFSLRVRKMKTRWGVNNVSKNIITLNSELIKKDISLLDYVIVHELCHFYQANHSKKFWMEVEKRYPNYKEARKSLRS